MTATAHTDIRPLSADQLETVSGGFAALGMTIATQMALQQVPPANQPPVVIGPMRGIEPYADKVRQYIKS